MTKLKQTLNKPLTKTRLKQKMPNKKSLTKKASLFLLSFFCQAFFVSVSNLIFVRFLLMVCQDETKILTWQKPYKKCFAFFVRFLSVFQFLFHPSDFNCIFCFGFCLIYLFVNSVDSYNFSKNNMGVLMWNLLLNQKEFQ